MSWNRREVLATLGMASANAILFACGAPAKRPQRRTQVNPELRTWLSEAVALLHGAGLASPHALAVSRKRSTAALDVLGAGVARHRCDGVVLTVRDTDGMSREQATNDLSRDGILAAVRALTGNNKAKAASLDFGARPMVARVPGPDPDELSDGQLLSRVSALAARDRGLSSRIVYSASVLDIEDAHVWSVAPGRMLEQRIVRVRRALTRVAWHGTRPIVSEVERAWTGSIDAQDLTDDEVMLARDNALALPSPRAFDDGEYGIVLEPQVAASVLDVAVRSLVTRDALRRPEVAKRFADGAQAAAALLSIVDDPAAPMAYGGFAFDDRGTPGTAQTLVDKGRLVGRVDRARRPGHVGRVESSPSHLRVGGGTVEADDLLDAGLILEGPIDTRIDPASDRVVVQVARARERANKRRTGRVFADVELVGELTALLGGITDLSKQTRAVGIRDEVDGQPRWRSIETPWLRGKATLRQRRRTT